MYVCYLSARHRPSQITATPQPICVITAIFTHFPDNVLHPSNPSSIASYPPLLLLASFASLNLPHFPLSSILSRSSILLPQLYFCYPLSPVHYFILLLNLLFFFFLFYISSFFLSSLLSPLLPTLPLSPCSIPPILQCSPHIRKCWILTSACRSSDP